MTDEIRKKLLASSQLPTLPAIAVEVLELAQCEEVDLAQIAKTISRDPALTARILKTVNSSFYGRAHAVSTVSHALVLLGLQAVKTLVLGFSLVPTLMASKRAGSFDRMTYWRRTLHTATAARLLAVRAGIAAQQEEAFLAALLADVGVLVLDRVLGDEYGTVHAHATSHANLASLEDAAFGVSHPEVARLLVEQWQLPPLLVEPIAFHHAPTAASSPPLAKLSAIVGLAGRCGDVFVDAEPDEAVCQVRAEFARLLAPTSADADALLAEIAVSTREVATLFEVNVGATIDLDAVLKRANDTLVDFTLRSQARATELAEQNAVLKTRATTDRLTGLANRARFDEVMAEHFAAAEGVLSLVMFDVDRFKSVNDRHGHDAGDAVLTHLGTILRQLTRPSDLAARYGGEELALVLPKTTRADASQIAERLRLAVANAPAQCGTITIPLTVSLGVATREPGSPLREPAHLIKAADLAMYKAKHSGRNNVKVFALPVTAKAA